jgi:hypothetical protein
MTFAPEPRTTRRARPSSAAKVAPSRISAGPVLRYLPGAAGAGYLLAWVGALAAWPVNLSLNASGAQVAATYRLHPAEAIAQYVLAEGLAGVLLGTVLIGALVSRRWGRISPPTAGALGLCSVAVATSLAQCVIGFLITAAAVDHDAARCAALSALVNRLDGVKMLALAGAAIGLAMVTKRRALSRWLQVIAIPLALALIASGYAYLTLSNSLAWTALISGPLLILWVTGTGITLTLRRRESTSRAGGPCTASA